MTVLKFSPTKKGFKVHNLMQRGTPVIGRIADGQFIIARGRLIPG